MCEKKRIIILLNLTIYIINNVLFKEFDNSSNNE